MEDTDEPRKYIIGLQNPKEKGYPAGAGFP
jgi:hypothetical protein